MKRLITSLIAGSVLTTSALASPALEVQQLGSLSCEHNTEGDLEEALSPARAVYPDLRAAFFSHVAVPKTSTQCNVGHCHQVRYCVVEITPLAKYRLERNSQWQHETDEDRCREWGTALLTGRAVLSSSASTDHTGCYLDWIEVVSGTDG